MLIYAKETLWRRRVIKWMLHPNQDSYLHKTNLEEQSCQNNLGAGCIILAWLWEDRSHCKSKQVKESWSGYSLFCASSNAIRRPQLLDLKGMKYICFHHQVWPVIKYVSGGLTAPYSCSPGTDDSDTGEKLHPCKYIILVIAQHRKPPCSMRSSPSTIKPSSAQLEVPAWKGAAKRYRLQWQIFQWQFLTGFTRRQMDPRDCDSSYFILLFLRSQYWVKQYLGSPIPPCVQLLCNPC